MAYEKIRIPAELSEQVQKVYSLHAGSDIRTLGKLTDAFAREARSPQPDGLISKAATRHLVRMGSETFYTHCFIDGLMLPFALQGQKVEIQSTSPESDEPITAVVTAEAAEFSPQSTVVSFGVARKVDGSLQACLCPYLNAFASRSEYECWAEANPQAVTIALSLPDAFAFARDWALGGKVCC